MSSKNTGVSIGNSIVCLGVDQRKHESSASLAFAWGIHRWPVNSPHKKPVTQKSFHLMTSLWPFLLLPNPVLNTAMKTYIVKISTTSPRNLVVNCPIVEISGIEKMHIDYIRPVESHFYLACLTTAEMWRWHLLNMNIFIITVNR